jgi:transposase
VLLERIWGDDAPSYLRRSPAIETLRRCWIAQYWTGTGAPPRRHAGNLPPGPLRIDSPYDIETRYCIKRSTEWVDYKVHLAKICSPGSPT